MCHAAKRPGRHEDAVLEMKRRRSLRPPDMSLRRQAGRTAAVPLTPAPREGGPSTACDGHNTKRTTHTATREVNIVGRTRHASAWHTHTQTEAKARPAPSSRRSRAQAVGARPPEVRAPEAPCSARVKAKRRAARMATELTRMTVSALASCPSAPPRPCPRISAAAPLRSEAWRRGHLAGRPSCPGCAWSCVPQAGWPLCVSRPPPAPARSRSEGASELRRRGLLTCTPAAALEGAKVGHGKWARSGLLCSASLSCSDLEDASIQETCRKSGALRVPGVFKGPGKA